MTAIKDLSPQDVSYNGISFGQLTSFHVRAAPEYDRANRTTISTLYTISARSIEYAATESSLGSTMLQKRQLLLEAGKTLVINGIGFGNTSTGGRFPDITWGPRPRQATFQPLGGGVCYQLDWVCDFRITDCASAGLVRTTGGKPLMAFNYDVTYSNDEWGFGTRVIQGTAMIPQPRSGKVVADTAMDYRNRVIINIPNGYRRVRNDWRMGAAQNELDFTIVDEQLKTEAPPNGIAKADVQVGLSARSSGGGIFPAWILTVAGTMETLPGWPKSFAAARFFVIVASYVKALRAQLGSVSIVLPVALDMRFGAFGRASQFNTAFMVPTAAKLNAQIVGSRVLYSPLPDSSYASWRASSYGSNNLENLWSFGGQSKIRTSTPEIIDLCDATNGVQLSGTANLYPLSGGFPDPGPAGYYSGTGLTPRNSWLAYGPEMSLSRDDRRSVNKRDITVTFPTPAYGDPKAAFGQPDSSYPNYTAPSDKVSGSGAPEQHLVFSGRAVRLGYEIALPQIPSINGVKLDWLGGETESIRGPSLIENVPMFYGSWEHHYRPQSFIGSDSLAMPHPHLDA